MAWWKLKERILLKAKEDAQSLNLKAHQYQRQVNMFISLEGVGREHYVNNRFAIIGFLFDDKFIGYDLQVRRVMQVVRQENLLMRRVSRRKLQSLLSLD